MQQQEFSRCTRRETGRSRGLGETPCEGRH